jgi:murein DD-endopeptidase MepM/ murein hydrolase activator NlpD
MMAAALQAAGPPQPRPVFAEPARAVEPSGDIEAAMLSPLFRDHFACGDHGAGEESVVGDALGTDCQIVAGMGEGGRNFRRLYRTDGLRNEDWYSWGAEVLAPFDGVVTGLFPNSRVNEPGSRGRPPAGMIQMQRAGGLVVLYGHVTDFRVAVGDRITAGQIVAKVGNNGPSYAPHVHVGAYRGVTPLQIRWDQRAMARLTPPSPAPAAN